jgi:hypothetical protein
MHIIDRLYDVLGIKENKKLYQNLLINYASFVLLFVIVALTVRQTTKPLPERKVEASRVKLSPTRKEKIIEKVRNSPIRLQPRRKINLSDTLL